MSQLSPKVITNWSIRGSDFEAPEVRKLHICGMCEDRPIRTSYIVSKVDKLTYQTKSGSLYRLEGKPEDGYVKFCKRSGIVIDLEDPVKFRNTGSEFQWNNVKVGRAD